MWTPSGQPGKPPSEFLLQQPWLPVNIDGCPLLIKSWFGDIEYHILLTDMSCVWEERMFPGTIEGRVKELNKRLRAPTEAFFSHLRQVAQPCLTGSDVTQDGEAQLSLKRDLGTKRSLGGHILMDLKSELAGLPFYWRFHCIPAHVTLACVQLMRPLMAMTHLLQRQAEQLGGLLARKDQEIQDYRENGATLSRERLQTKAFEEQTFRKDFIAETLPLLTGEHQEVLIFDSALRRLYASVIAHGNGTKRKRRPSNEDEPPPAEEPDLNATNGEAVEQDREAETPEATTEQPSSSVSRLLSLPATPEPAQRPPSRPKKKKVGLFR